MTMGGDAATDAAPRIEADWLSAAPMQALFDALEAGAAGAEARFVGGCVRNRLIGAGATDLDIAYNQPPDIAAQALVDAGLPAHPTGVAHGTYTTVVDLPGAPHTPVEITSLRRDVSTDGRRAVVAFTADWAEDAGRRDFTMNALYADRSGVVFDPLGQGVADLLARRLRFIGDADRRIQEDALRLLRYVRFAAWYGPAEDLRPTLHAADIAAVQRRAGTISTLPGERIGVEILKLLSAPAPWEATALADGTGLLAPSLGLSKANTARLAALGPVEKQLELSPNSLRRLAALAKVDATTQIEAVDPEVRQLTQALRLSNANAARLRATLTGLATPPPEGKAIRLAQAHGAEIALDVVALREVSGGSPTATEPIVSFKRRLVAAEAARMPVTARDLMSIGFSPGRALGVALKTLEDKWRRSDFTLGRDALLASISQDSGGAP